MSELNKLKKKMKRRKRQTTYWGEKNLKITYLIKDISEYIKSPKSSIIRKQIKNEKKIWTDPKKEKEKIRDQICGYHRQVGVCLHARSHPTL